MQPKSVGIIFTLSCAMVLFSACATLSEIPPFGVTIQVMDEADAPLAGATVESSDGQKATTGRDGNVSLKYGSMGLHRITVMAQNRAPASFSVIMPLDSGKTVPARLGETVGMDANVNIGNDVNIGSNFSGMFVTALYPLIFQSMFTAYGYNTDLIPYKPGEWTDWNFQSEKKTEMTMRKAFLARLDNRQEWWQVQLNREKKDDALAFEVLFSAERQSIRRMRQKSGEGNAAEVPISEGWYSAPKQLTPESIEGAVVKKGVEITVPAGKFNADLLEFASLGSEARVRMWRVKGVPGGVVKVELTEKVNEPVWVSELKAHGKDAKTILNSF